MSKPIASYPSHQQSTVISRRMRQYDPKGSNGMGTLAAKAAYDKKLLRKVKDEENKQD